MTPKEKAIELYKKFSFNGYNIHMGLDGKLVDRAKQSALRAAEEIFNVLLQINETYEERAYWNEVIKELIKI